MKIAHIIYIIIFVFLIFIGVKITLNVIEKYEEVILAKECAIDYIEKKYPGHKFIVSNLRVSNGDYIIKLKVDKQKYQLVSITCLVRKRVNNSEEFYASEWLSTNAYLLEN